MIKIDRDAAIARGWNKFFTGHPCKHGHIGPRYVIRFTCVACIAAKNLSRWQRKATAREASGGRAASGPAGGVGRDHRRPGASIPASARNALAACLIGVGPSRGHRQIIPND